MVIPKLILVWKDKNEQNEYGVSLLKEHLSDKDFAAQYRVRIDTLEAENSQLRKRLRGGTNKKLSFTLSGSHEKHTDYVSMNGEIAEDTK